MFVCPFLTNPKFWNTWVIFFFIFNFAFLTNKLLFFFYKCIVTGASLPTLLIFKPKGQTNYMYTSCRVLKWQPPPQLHSRQIWPLKQFPKHLCFALFYNVFIKYTKNLLPYGHHHTQQDIQELQLRTWGIYYVINSLLS